MIYAPLSLYYATKLELSMWSSLNEQSEAADWQDPEWINKPEGYEDVESDNKDANPYRRYCRDHHLEIGTEIKHVSKAKYNTVLLITCSIESLKYVAGTIESLVLLAISLVISGVSLAATTLGLNRICPSRIKIISTSVKEHIYSPAQNFDNCKYVFVMSIMNLQFPIICYANWNKDHISDIYDIFGFEVARMDGVYESLEVEEAKSEGSR